MSTSLPRETGIALSTDGKSCIAPERRGGWAATVSGWCLTSVLERMVAANASDSYRPLPPHYLL